MAYTVFDALRAGFGQVVIVTRPSLRGPLQAHLEEHLGPDLPLAWVFQEMDDIPEAHRSKAPSRVKPWGTGHAVLSCGAHLPGAFAVANADDWYGPEALAALVEGLRALDRTGPCSGLLLGFPMAATLPPTGAGVSRGWVRSSDGWVEGVLELRDTARTPDPGDSATSGRPTQGPAMAEGLITGTDPQGRRVTVPEGAWASMNLWGFSSCAPPLLSSAFDDFLSHQGEDADAEFDLSSAVDSLITAGSFSLVLVPEGRRWFGITHPGDAPWVRDLLHGLHADGTYPRSLSVALRRILADLAL